MELPLINGITVLIIFIKNTKLLKYKIVKNVIFLKITKIMYSLKKIKN